MSEPNNAFPFSDVKAEGPLDISAIFGESVPNGEEDPFDMPAAHGPIEVPAFSQGQDPEEAAPAPAAEPEPAAVPEPEQQPVAPAPQAEPAPEPEPQTSQTAEPRAGEPNLIASAFIRQEENNARQGLFEKAPVFCHKNVKEPIEDADITFEELRIRKSEDFADLEEGKSVSWTVEYCGIRKEIKDPKGTTIISVKQSIERSREFLDALRKSKNKVTDCLVKPRVTMKAKGIAAYKGYFSTVEDARASDKVICLIPGGDGRFYELQKTEQGEFIAPKDRVVEFPQIRAGFIPALPLIPMSLISQIIGFFRAFMEKNAECEALALIYWDKIDREYFAYVPKQKVTRDRIDADLRDCPYDDEDRYICYADIHSHNSMDAYFSSTDDWDEKGTGLYLVVGHLEKFLPDIEARISCGGSFVSIDPAIVIEGLGEESSYPRSWLANVTCMRAAAGVLKKDMERLS